ncbi:MAG: N-formylglutamate amidohydrolase [Patescibacteria group bacterium]
MKKGAKNILVIIPHASRARPKEIKADWLSGHQERFLSSNEAETDRYSDKLYNFQQLIGSRQLLFPYSQIFLNVCRRPSKLNESCPLNIRGVDVYKIKPSVIFRKELIKKYCYKYYDKISRFNGVIIFNGHTTIAGHSSLKEKLRHRIVISNITKVGEKTRKFAPDDLVKIYVNELRKHLPGVTIGINSAYMDVDEYICDKFGWRNNGSGIPIIHQETDEGLYIKNNKLDRKKLNKLRDIFAEALLETVNKYAEKNN